MWSSLCSDISVRERVCVRACPCVCMCVGLLGGSRPYGRWYLGVLPSGLSPHGVSSFYTLGWGSGDLERNGLQSVQSLPHTCSQSLVVPCVPSPRGVAIAFLAGLHSASSPLVVLGYEHGG